MSQANEVKKTDATQTAFVHYVLTLLQKLILADSMCKPAIINMLLHINLPSDDYLSGAKSDLKQAHKSLEDLSRFMTQIRSVNPKLRQSDFVDDFVEQISMLAFSMDTEADGEVPSLQQALDELIAGGLSKVLLTQQKVVIQQLLVVEKLYAMLEIRESQVYRENDDTICKTHFEQYELLSGEVAATLNMLEVLFSENWSQFELEEIR